MVAVLVLWNRAVDAHRRRSVVRFVRPVIGTRIPRSPLVRFGRTSLVSLRTGSPISRRNAPDMGETLPRCLATAPRILLLSSPAVAFLEQTVAPYDVLVGAGGLLILLFGLGTLYRPAAFGPY